MNQRRTPTFVPHRIANFLRNLKRDLMPKSTKYGSSIFAFNDRVNLEREVEEQMRKRSLGIY